MFPRPSPTPLNLLPQDPPPYPTCTPFSLRTRSKLPSGPTGPTSLVPESLLPWPPSVYWAPVTVPTFPSQGPPTGCSSAWNVAACSEGALLARQLERLSPPQRSAEASCLLVYELVVCLPHPHPGAQNINNRRAGSSQACKPQSLVTAAPPPPPPPRDKARPQPGQTFRKQLLRDDGTCMRTDDRL